jgi:hypothetical protein
MKGEEIMGKKKCGRGEREWEIEWVWWE